MSKNITCNIIRKIAVLSPQQSGWQLELNEVVWNDDPPKLDLRRWNGEHERKGKGVTLTRKEARSLLATLEKELEE